MKRQLTRKEVLRYKSALGAQFTERLGRSSAQGPLGLPQLSAEVSRRLRSRGGRPTMSGWELKRPVPFSRETWRRLEEIGRDIGLSPAQFAALIVEKALATFTEAAREEVRRKLARKSEAG